MRNITVSPRKMARDFAQDTSGTMTVFAFFFFLLFIVLGGMAVDFMRFEEQRVRMQYTLDRAVLAAADLDQGLDADAVVFDYFAKAGLEGAVGPDDVTPIIRTNCRDVTAVASFDMPTFFISMVGIDDMTIPAGGRAMECISDVEISLVLDNSNSMNSYSRLTNLKAAAIQFVDDMIEENEVDADGNIIDSEDRVSISIIPFSTQVNLGPDLGSHFNLSSEHDYSHCVRFGATDFSTVAVDETTALQREGHFNRWEYNFQRYDRNYGVNRPMDPMLFECVPDSSRHVLPWEVSQTALFAYINALEAEGNTSIDIGAKWGAALLDPTLRDVVQARIDATPSKTDSDLAGRPIDYGSSEVLKVLVIMSDGANTSQAFLTDDYMGMSEVWVDENNSWTYADDEYSHYDLWRGEDWWWHYDRRDNYYGPWKRHPDEDSSGEAYAMSYHEVFERMSVEGWSKRINEKFHDADDNPTGSMDGYNAALDFVDGAAKDIRLANICQAAKNAGILVFTIRFEITPGSSEDTLLRNCATAPSYSFDPSGVAITTAFSSIESTINQLRLVE